MINREVKYIDVSNMSTKDTMNMLDSIQGKSVGSSYRSWRRNQIFFYVLTGAYLVFFGVLLYLKLAGVTINT